MAICMHAVNLLNVADCGVDGTQTSGVRWRGSVRFAHSRDRKIEVPRTRSMTRQRAVELLTNAYCGD
jgi:hypothetical protein